MLPSPFLYADKLFYLHLIVKSAICFLNVYNLKNNGYISANAGL